MKKPFVTATESTTSIEVLLITLTNNGINGRAETLGVDYLGESADTIKRQIEEHRGEFTRGITLKSLQTLLPPGGARNGIDCALWDLEAKKQIIHTYYAYKYVSIIINVQISMRRVLAYRVLCQLCY